MTVLTKLRRKLEKYRRRPVPAAGHRVALESFTVNTTITVIDFDELQRQAAAARAQAWTDR